jgi:hypothetical protein
MKFNSACPSTDDVSIACREIEVFTDRARTGTGEVLTFSLTVVAFGQKSQIFYGEIEIECSAAVQITTPAILSSSATAFAQTTTYEF